MTITPFSRILIGQRVRSRLGRVPRWNRCRYQSGKCRVSWKCVPERLHTPTHHWWPRGISRRPLNLERSNELPWMGCSSRYSYVSWIRLGREPLSSRIWHCICKCTPRVRALRVTTNKYHGSWTNNSLLSSSRKSNGNSNRQFLWRLYDRLRLV